VAQRFPPRVCVGNDVTTILARHVEVQLVLRIPSKGQVVVRALDAASSRDPDAPQNGGVSIHSLASIRACESRWGFELLVLSCRRRGTCTSIVATLSVWVLVSLLLGCRAPQEPAVFLIVVDTLRADRLSSYGYAKHQTPNVDKLATSGVRFTNVHSAASWTVPSMVAMMTSRHPAALGFIERPAPAGTTVGRHERRKQLALVAPRSVEMLAQHMQRRGLRTAAFVNQPGLNTLSGFVRGFDDYHYPVSASEAARLEPGLGLPAQDWKLMLDRSLETDRTLVSALDRWLEDQADAGLFVWVHLLTPHTPYADAPEDRPEGPAGPSDSDRYDAEIRQVDALIGELTQSIERHVGLDRARIVFTSDHGEAFGDHGSFEHGQSLHREVVRVPLIVVAPSLPRDHSVAAHVTTIDIAPTLLELAGIDPRSIETMEGESLLSLVEGNPADRRAYSAGMLYGPTERSLVDDGYKLMYDAETGHHALYNLRSDPEEANDLAGRDPDRLASMRAEMDEIHGELSLRYADEHPESARVAPGLAVEERLEAALQALGYTE
jgi:arylsulfatase A-like enzyme